MKLRWKDALEEYVQLYDRFKVNWKYREHMDGYEMEQKRLVDRIDELDAEVMKQLEAFASEVVPEARVIAFDSRMHMPTIGRIGSVLVEGLKSDGEKLELETWIEKQTGLTVAVMQLEKLSPEVREKFSRREGERASNAAL